MLSADAVEKANSGHPGLPMGAAAFAYTLWDRHLKFNPKNPGWINRDRFVLSAGHGSMLLYSLLHLTGYEVLLDDLKQFRQWGSKTPGHPEHGLTPGVETTTGPLGQGFANAIGMALAEKWLAKKFNQPGHEIIDYYTYALVSDGDLMEGISSEAASYAGKLGLRKAIFLYDDNDISIEGSTDITFSEDVQKRFDAYGWHTQTVKDGNDCEEVSRAIESAKKDERPSLIIIKTTIGFGSPNKQATAGVHGAPLGSDELAATKENFGWPAEPVFYVPKDVSNYMGKHVNKGAEAENTWQTSIAAYEKDYPELAEELAGLMAGTMPLQKGWEASLPVFASDESLATREASGRVMNAVAPFAPNMIGGSADLGPSNNTNLADFGNVTAEGWGDSPRNLHFGVREHAMAAIANGLALSGLRPFAATFLIFSDYMRGAMRLSALMELPVIYVLTHDSIGQGEDGATHQPVEHLASLRAMPNMTVIRPADANETVEAWRFALQHVDGPTVMALSRQKLPVLTDPKLAAELHRGAYIIQDSQEKPDLIIMASGSELQLAVQAAERLTKDKIAVRVVSFPSWELFEIQDKYYRESVLSPDVKKRLAIEAASSFGWERYVGPEGRVVSIDTFGASAPGDTMMQQFGFTTENVISTAKEMLRA